MAEQRKPRILFTASEVAPFSKVGGLAEVTGGLPEALAALGYEVMVVSPRYKSLKTPEGITLAKDENVTFPFDHAPCEVGVEECSHNGVRYVFVDHADFQREKVYGYEDDAMRFARFCRAIPDVASSLGFAPDLVHANDQHTGYLPTILRHLQHLPKGFSPDTPCVFSIHNAGYNSPVDLLSAIDWLGLPARKFNQMHLEYNGAANPVWSGVGNSDRAIVVSETHAQELTTLGYPYKGLLLEHFKEKIVGIANGLNVRDWNPETDVFLPDNCRFSAADWDNKLNAKALLAQEMNLDADRPTIGVVSRLDGQKGLDVLLESVDGLLEQGWNIAILGTGDPKIMEALREKAAQHGGRIGLTLGFDEGLAHKIMAGSDAVLMPSRYEPCGLVQMQAQRYGTIPVVADTGGLHETVEDGKTGFKFPAPPTREGILEATRRAMAIIKEPLHLGQMIERCMNLDVSWKGPAEKYAALYQEVIQERAKAAEAHIA